jgi:hypothetical protein
MATYKFQANESIVIADSPKAKVIRHIEESNEIPEDAKQAVKDFIDQAWDQIVSDTLSNIPDAIADYIDVIMEIVRSVIGN